MNRRQFFVLFLCTLIPWWVGSGLVSLLPLYAKSLGASPLVVGNYLSFLFLALACGTLVGGWLAPKVRNFRRFLMVLGANSAVAILLMGYVTSIWQLIPLTVAAWFSAGITVSLVMILVGEHTGKGTRGRTFGLLAMAASLGGVLAGVAGFIVDQWGYTWLFVLASATWVVQILVASFLTNPPRRAWQGPIAQSKETQSRETQSREASSLFAMSLVLLLGGALLVATANFAGFLGRTLAMEANGFTISTISLIGSLGAALSLVITPLLGHLSDRGRRGLLLGILYLVGALALGISAYSRTVTDFVFVGILLAINTAERGISVALVSDFVPPHALNRSLALFESVKWLGAVIGLAGTGYAIEQIGLASLLLWSTLLPVLATLLLLVLHAGKVRPGQLLAPRIFSIGRVQPKDARVQ